MGFVERHPIAIRWVLAGPLAFILTVLSLAALPHLLPVGSGGINHLVYPTIFIPITWSALIVWPVMTERLLRCLAIYIGLIGLSIAIVVFALM
ncbi:MAG: hypothetical protein AAGE89_08280 [Pseudomonadota bacterium]